jgi:excisionase family DNA binding protein
VTIDAKIVQQVVSEILKMSSDAVAQDLQLMKMGQVASYLGIGRSTAYALANNGELPAVRVGGRMRVRPRALLAYVMLKEISHRPQEAVAA